MAAHPRSLQITDTYRDRLNRLADRLGQLTAHYWQTVILTDLDRSHAQWVAVTTAMLEQAQQQGVHLTAAYLAAFVASEQGRRASEIDLINAQAYAGLAADGRGLAQTLAPTAITVKTALKQGKSPQEALQEGQDRAVRLATSAVMSAPRTALQDRIATHPEIEGWRRVTHGGCGACLAAAAHGYDRHEPMRVHDHCHCTAEPVVRDVPDTAPRSTGPEIFYQMSAAEQDASLGPAAAKLVRQGLIAWPDLIAVSPMKIGPDMLTQAPVEALAA
jgi:hypothetical protein